MGQRRKSEDEGPGSGIKYSTRTNQEHSSSTIFSQIITTLEIKNHPFHLLSINWEGFVYRTIPSCKTPFHVSHLMKTKFKQQLSG